MPSRRTDLASRLAALKKPNVVLVGFMTHMCVEATARASIDLGFKATVIASATATRAAARSAQRRWRSPPRRSTAMRSPPSRIRFATVAEDVDALPD